MDQDVKEKAMDELIIREGMWQDCINFAGKVTAHCKLMSYYDDEPSEANKAMLDKWDQKLRGELIHLSILYQCNSYVLADLINTLISISSLVPLTKLESYDPVGSTYRIGRIQTWIYDKKED